MLVLASQEIASHGSIPGSSAANLELAQGGRLAGRDREALGGASGSARLKPQLH